MQTRTGYQPGVVLLRRRRGRGGSLGILLGILGRLGHGSLGRRILVLIVQKVEQVPGIDPGVRHRVDLAGEKEDRSWKQITEIFAKS